MRPYNRITQYLTAALLVFDPVPVIEANVEVVGKRVMMNVQYQYSGIKWSYKMQLGYTFDY